LHQHEDLGYIKTKHEFNKFWWREGGGGYANKLSLNMDIFNDYYLTFILYTMFPL